MSCAVEQIGGRGPVSGTPEPSSSLLLKQLSMMRRFSSSKRSARLMPGAVADMVASPSVRNLRRALGPGGWVAGRFVGRWTAGWVADGGYPRTARQREVQDDVAGPGLRLCSRYGMECVHAGQVSWGPWPPRCQVPRYRNTYLCP